MKILKVSKNKKTNFEKLDTGAPNKKQQFFYAFVNSLTLVRILVIPILGVLIYSNTYNGTLWTLIITILACITDWLDGALARHFNIRSKLGKFLDPIADKLLVVCTLLFILLWREESIWIEISVLLIVAREIIISGLREHMASTDVPVKLSYIAKSKTAVQCVAISMLIGKPIAFNVLWYAEYTLKPFFFFTTIMLILSAFIAVISAYDYLTASFHHLVTFKKEN